MAETSVACTFSQSPSAKVATSGPRRVASHSGSQVFSLFHRTGKRRQRSRCNSRPDDEQLTSASYPLSGGCYLSCEPKAVLELANPRGVEKNGTRRELSRERRRTSKDRSTIETLVRCFCGNRRRIRERCSIDSFFFLSFLLFLLDLDWEIAQ